MTESFEHPTEWLVRAVNELPPAERDRVMSWLLTTLGQAATSQALSFLPRLSGQEQDVVTEAHPSPLRGVPQVVPVRLSVEQHAQLRGWCREHGFAMATVIRGLVGRFLVTQGVSSTERGGEAGDGASPGVG